MEVVVTSLVDYELEWSIELEIRGAITSVWNANPSGDVGTVTFTGVEWNRVLAPGGNASFGFVGAF